MRRPVRSLAFAVVCVLPWASSAIAAFQASGGIRMVAVTGETEGAELVLENAKHVEVGRGKADRLGSLMFRELDPGGGYVVRETGGATAPVTVLAFDDHPDASFYAKQQLTEGFQYIQARDGTLLATMVRPPLGGHLVPGQQYPTVVEYSGYATADPDSPQPITLIASFLGFATVSVNMRGSGCSGGVLDLFDLPTTADGYDIIETVAAQPWVKGGRAGMVGISFSGISQLFVAGARPPHLAAVAPLSVIADIYRAPGFPGGIFNSGFAKEWLEERKSDAQPAPEGGQEYAIARVEAGDEVCRANQRLRLQTIDPVEFTESHPYDVPELFARRSPINWVHRIDVPTFLVSAWQDEQTGGDFASMLSRMPRRDDVKITVTNGVHSSALDPDILWNWVAFLDLYVARQPADPGRIAIAAPVIYPMIFGNGTPVPPLPVDRFDNLDLGAGMHLFAADPYVRILMENGAGSPIPGVPAPTFELGATRWPLRAVRATAYYFGPDGTLVRRRPHRGGVDTYHPDPNVRPLQSLPGTGQDASWEIIPAYDWRPLVDGTALAYATPPLDRDVMIAGPGSVDLWLRSSDADTDIQATLTEIRPDGLETYVQNGWLRASHRKLDRKTSTVLEPRPTHLERDAKPLPRGEFSKLRVGLFAVAHVFRKGSRIRVSIEAPGGDRTRWDFDTKPTQGNVQNEIARTPRQPSRIVLPVLDDDGVKIPAALPPCPGLRGQPCRPYVAASNGG